MIRSARYLSLFLWLIAAATLYGIFVNYGLPHIIWSYTFLDNGDRFNPYANRHYTSCTFAGPYGVFKVDAQYGRCGWVRLFTERG